MNAKKIILSTLIEIAKSAASSFASTAATNLANRHVPAPEPKK